MTVAVLKTKAEQAFLDEFERQRPGLPGTGWIADLRGAAIRAFAARGLPSRRVEEWKYTDLRERVRDTMATGAAADALEAGAFAAALGPLASIDAHRAVLVDGRFSAALSSPQALTGALLTSLAPGLATEADWLRPLLSDTATDAGAASVRDLNVAFMTDGLMLKVADGVAIEKPVLLVNVTTVDRGFSAIRNAVGVGVGARLSLIEAHVALDGVGARMTNTATVVDIADGGRLDHIQVVAEGSGITHLAQWRALIGARASYRAFQLTAGAALARNELQIGFTGADARLDISGAFLGRGGDHIDTTLVVDHSTTGCESRELFKGVLDGRARGVFQGKIVVQAEAQKTDGKQMAQALMLSEDAEFDSKPELEIYADDVACGHGSTAAEIDGDMLFYLRSRGIPPDEARALLVESFVGEAIDKVEDEAVRAALMETALAWLRRPAVATE